MKFIKELNDDFKIFNGLQEAFKLIHIDDETGEETEIDLDALIAQLDAGEESDTTDTGEIESDDMPSDDSEDSDDSEMDLDLGKKNSGNYNANIHSNLASSFDDEADVDDEDELDSDDETDGELALDPDATGLDFGKPYKPRGQQMQSADDQEGSDDDVDFGDDDMPLPDEEDEELDADDDEEAPEMDDLDMDDVEVGDEDDDDLASFVGKYASADKDGDLAPTDDEDDAEEGDQDDTDTDDESMDGDEDDVEGMGDEDDSDPDFQGTIRTVRGACLVYKRKNPDDGTFTELWAYTVGDDMKADSQVRRAVLSATDINPSTERSDDGEQTCTTSTLGNIAFLYIQNLPN